MKTTSPRTSLVATAVLTLAGLTACGSMSMSPPYSQAALPASVQVPAGHAVAWETVGIGSITYQCDAKKDMANQFEWRFVGPDAKLNNREGKQVGKYFGPPATWESMDGSKVTGVQLAVAPNSSGNNAGNIPLQLVKANPAMGSGGMNGVSYIQRVATQGGVAPTSPCDMAAVGSKQVVNYQADYIFYKPQ
jgi:Protein of unknown function (DUF3455)